MNYVIIGNGTAAIAAIESIRKTDKQNPITLISRENAHCYSKPMIAHLTADEIESDAIYYRDKDFYKTNNVKTLLNTSVASIDTNKNLVKLENNSTVSYGKLLIATGGKQVVPPIEGLDTNGVFMFQTLADACAINEFKSKVKHAVVIGAGLIGIRALHALEKNNIKVTIVEMLPQILPAFLDKTAAGILETLIRKNGHVIHANTKVLKINSKNGAIESVTLSNGSTVPCEMAVLATGVVPNIDIVKNTKVKSNKGIVVNKHMLTNVPDVFAAGDAAETTDASRNIAAINANMPNAYKQGAVAGQNMAGTIVEYDGSMSMNSVEFYGVPCITIGEINPREKDEVFILQSELSGFYKKLVVRDNIVKGAILLGNLRFAGTINKLVQSHANVAEFKNEILTEGKKWFDFIKNNWKDDMLGNVQWAPGLSSQQKYVKKVDEDVLKKREQGRF
ncbi:MAG: NAD(P)/FAD-dependent oxidoreductase [Planctomycetes bacterium]|nr:NAD(P)/FAD-dependent oxidoreductase [Planctomycetota bacterium]